MHVAVVLVLMALVCVEGAPSHHPKQTKVEGLEEFEPCNGGDCECFVVGTNESRGLKDIFEKFEKPRKGSGQNSDGPGSALNGGCPNGGVRLNNVCVEEQ